MACSPRAYKYLYRQSAPSWSGKSTSRLPAMCMAHLWPPLLGHLPRRQASSEAQAPPQKGMVGHPFPLTQSKQALTLCRRTLINTKKSACLSTVDCLLTKPSSRPPSPTRACSQDTTIFFTPPSIRPSPSTTPAIFPLAPVHGCRVRVHAPLRVQLRRRAAVLGLDTGHPGQQDSPVFKPIIGFIGNGVPVPTDPNDHFTVPGRTGGRCVADGPFVGRSDMVHLGPMGGVKLNP